MEKIVLAFLATAALCGTVSAVCDNTTSSKIEECVFKSDLLNADTIAQNADAVNSYCSANATNNCLATNLGECSTNDRQSKLMDSLLTHKRITDGQMYLCMNKTVLDGGIDCLQDFQKQEVKDCLKAAVGKRVNTDSTDLKAKLNTMCTFFNEYAMCFDSDAITENCKKVGAIFKDAVNGLKYAYCDMDDAGKKAVVDDYLATGAASVVTGSVLTVLTAYLLSTIY